MKISVYDHTGDRRIAVEVRAGDLVDWKPRGRLSVRCVVMEVRERSGRLKLDAPGQPTVPATANFLALWRNGTRLSAPNAEK